MSQHSAPHAEPEEPAEPTAAGPRRPDLSIGSTSTTPYEDYVHADVLTHSSIRCRTIRARWCSWSRHR